MSHSFKGDLFIQQHEILSQKTSFCGSSYSEDLVTLACTVLIRLQGVMDRHMDEHLYDSQYMLA